MSKANGDMLNGLRKSFERIDTAQIRGNLRIRNNKYSNVLQHIKYKKKKNKCWNVLS